MRQGLTVTQPYNISPLEIVDDLTLDEGVRPEIIDASDWGFYYPGEAKLFIVKFPLGFQKAMENFTKRLRRAEIEESWQKKSGQEEAEPMEFEDCDLA